MSNNQQSLDLPIERPFKEFKAHLDLEFNKRIFFSGIFGSGKTYFLRKFFEQQKDQYLTVNISPVHYAIAYNDDIFRFIRYDIIATLIQKFPTLSDVIKAEVKREKWEKIPRSFLFTKIPEFIKGLVTMIPKIGKPVVEGVDRIESALREWKKKATTLQDEMEAVEEIYDPDLMVTELIEEILNTLAEFNREKNQSPKEKVLIIDDLDRVDPNHIFRILNVFSVHFDPEEKPDNKFGFDKVILVGDIENIRRIFHAKYGAKVDFSGYIDKFYSRRIFLFDNSGIHEEVVKSIIENVNYVSEHHYFAYHSFFSNVSGLSNIGEFLSEIILSFVTEGCINIRRLKQAYELGVSLDVGQKTSKQISYFPHHSFVYNYPAIVFIQILLSFFDSCEDLRESILHIGDLNQKLKSHSDVSLKLFLPVLNWESTKALSKSHRMSFELDCGDLLPPKKLSYDLKITDEHNLFLASNIQFDDNEDPKTGVCPIKNLLNSLNLLRDWKVVK